MKMNFMKRAGFVLTCATMLANLCAAQNTERTPQGMKCTTQGMDIRVEFYSPSIVRVYKTPEGKPYNKESLVVVKSPETVKVDFSEEAGQTVLKSSILKIFVNPATGGISFHTIAGNELLKDKDYGTSFADKNDAGTPSYQVRGSFLLDKKRTYLRSRTSDGRQIQPPQLHAPHAEREHVHLFSLFHVACERLCRILGQLLHFRIHGYSAGTRFPEPGTLCGLLFHVWRKRRRHHRPGARLDGTLPMLPLWAYGFFQSKERYHTQEESLNVLKKYRELQIPIDCMIQDWRYWPEYQKTDSAWNSHSFDPERFPNPKKWADEIHKLNAKLMIVAWPGFGTHRATQRSWMPKA